MFVHAWICLSYLLLVPCVVVLYLPFANCLSCLFMHESACRICCLSLVLLCCTSLLLIACHVCSCMNLPVVFVACPLCFVLYLPFVTCLSCLFLAWGCLSSLLLGECRCFLFFFSFLSLLLVFIQAGCQSSIQMARDLCVIPRKLAVSVESSSYVSFDSQLSSWLSD